jgi:hypothetical protein
MEDERTSSIILVVILSIMAIIVLSFSLSHIFPFNPVISFAGRGLILVFLLLIATVMFAFIRLFQKKQLYANITKVLLAMMILAPYVYIILFIILEVSSILNNLLNFIFYFITYLAVPLALSIAIIKFDKVIKNYFVLVLSIIVYVITIIFGLFMATLSK